MRYINFLNRKNSLAGMLAAVTSLSVLSASAQPLVLADEQAQRSPATVVVRNGTLYFDGKITAESAEAMLRQLDMRRVESVSINSVGGDALSAVAIGRELHLRKLDVEVRNVCAAACASYLFPAGKSKFISQGSLLLWPGYPHTDAATDRTTAQNDKTSSALADINTTSPASVTALTEEQQQQITQFYQQTGVNPSLAGCPQWSTDATSSPQWFSWSVENLTKLGVKNITFATSATRWQNSMAAKGVLFADYCS